jgi:hypothetical protein
MIAKINGGASIFGAVSYNLEKVREGQARVILQNNMMENCSGNPDSDLHFALRSFEPYLIANQRTEKPVVHISLNPDPDDRLTDDRYAELAKDYMEKMGFGNQPYIVYKHEDIDRHHLHVVSVRVDENGKKISDSFEKMRSMDACRELETKYGLHPALKKKRESGENFIRKIDYERGDVKRQISNTVRTLLQMYRFQTFGEYNALLSCYNIDVKQVRGEKFGREYSGMVYAAKNDAGEIVSRPFKSSLLGKRFGVEALAKVMKNSTEILKKKDMTIRSKSVVAAAMKSARTMEAFKQALRSKNMDVVFRSNEQGRIYGVTFIDHENKVVVNGSRLGKEFSANVFHDLFHGNSQIQQQTPQQQPPANNCNQTQNTAAAPQPDTTGNLDGSTSASLLEDLSGLLDIQPHGEDYAEIAFARRMKKKKRKQKRHIQ